jgi:hypothetical protein
MRREACGDAVLHCELSQTLELGMVKTLVFFNLSKLWDNTGSISYSVNPECCWRLAETKL